MIEATKDINQNKIQWIFFDLDGTLADSLPVLFDIYMDFLSQFDIEGTTAEFTQLNGPSLPEIISLLKAKYSLDESQDELLERYTELINLKYHDAILPRHESSTLLMTLKNYGYKLALVSSADHFTASTFLKKFKLDHYFEHLITSTQVTQAKPHPALYQKACQEAGISPAVALAIEDSENGVASAKAAGINCLHLQTDQSILYQTLARLGEVSPNSDCHFETLFFGDMTLSYLPVRLNISDTNQNNIDKIWQAAQVEKPDTLFNGDILIFSNAFVIDNILHIEGDYAQYKQFLAQKSMSTDLGIRPIGVSGLIIFEDQGKSYTVLAKRSQSVTQYPGRLELVTAGNIDKHVMDEHGSINFTKQLLEEFTEESGLHLNTVSGITELCFMVDYIDKVYDICAIIYCKASAQDIRNSMTNQAEYTDPIFVAIDDLENFVNTHQAELVPTSIAIIQAYLKNKS